MKIGLFGGSFNPVHTTHIDVAKEVLQRFDLDKILLIPAGNPYHKKQGNMLPEQLRYELVQASVMGEHGLEASDIDMNASGPTYTIDTLREAARRYPDDELFFILGQDSFETFDQWKDWRRIPELANIIAVSRYKVDHGEMLSDFKRLFHGLEHNGDNVCKVVDGKLIYIITDLDFIISSTLVRDVWKAGGDVSQYVPSAVAQSLLIHSDEIKKYWF